MRPSKGAGERTTRNREEADDAVRLGGLLGVGAGSDTGIGSDAFNAFMYSVRDERYGTREAIEPPRCRLHVLGGQRACACQREGGWGG